MAPRETENNAYAKFWGVYSGIGPLLYFVPKTRFHEKVTCSPGQRF